MTTQAATHAPTHSKQQQRRAKLYMVRRLPKANKKVRGSQHLDVIRVPFIT